MNPDLLYLILKKTKVPNFTKGGILMSIFVFKAFDINGRVKRAMQPKPTA